jgi:hypothetical protein
MMGKGQHLTFEQFNMECEEIRLIEVAEIEK